MLIEGTVGPNQAKSATDHCERLTLQAETPSEAENIADLWWAIRTFGVERVVEAAKTHA